MLVCTGQYIVEVQLQNGVDSFCQANVHFMGATKSLFCVKRVLHISAFIDGLTKLVHSDWSKGAKKHPSIKVNECYRIVGGLNEIDLSIEKIYRSFQEEHVHAFYRKVTILIIASKYFESFSLEFLSLFFNVVEKMKTLGTSKISLIFFFYCITLNI